jgi:hypothetical protein
MTLNVKLNLPASLEENLRANHPNLDAEVTEVYALQLFRRGEISHHELALALSLDRFETDAYLKRHNVYEGSLTMGDLETDRQTLDRMFNKGQ